MTSTSDLPRGAALRRAVGAPGAVLIGLGSILGTGIFVSVALAASVAGPSALLAVIAAAVVAMANGLSSAQLAASDPVSGGTYEYGYRHLSPALGFVAGWTFLCAKSASAATAALGFAGYLLALLGADGAVVRIVVGLLAVAAVTAIAAGGVGRSGVANAILVTTTLGALAAFVVVGAPAAVAGAGPHLAGMLADADPPRDVLGATALMFVAYAGYGRIATLGEEVREPARTIPRAIVLALLAAMVVYGLVAAVAIGAVGAPALAAAVGHGGAAPLEHAARAFGGPWLADLVAVGAIAAMAGVLLNLVLGLSRVLVAMGRRRDLPAWLAGIEGRTGSPRRAVLVTGGLVAALVLVGDVATTWSFSAFTVLVYYALTNLAALRLPPGRRRYPRAIAAVGLASCLGLAFWVRPAVWLVGLGVIAVGLAWHAVARRRARPAA